MAQFARPDTDADNTGAYTDQGGGSTTIYTTIDESSPSDADYIRTPAGAGTYVYTARLSDVTDPVSSSNHVMRMRSSADQDAQQSVSFTMQLRMTYVNEGSPGTLIATHTRASITSTTWTDTSTTLSGAEADAITDYTALFYRFSIVVA